VKNILKKTVAGLLPEGITERLKEGFVLPVFDWMIDSLREYSLSLLSEKRLRRHHLFDHYFVQKAVNEFYRGDRGNAAKIWNLMMFQIWWERYFA